MATIIPLPTERSTRADTTLLVCIALAVALLHLLTNGRYGFHRDELQFMDDALHLDWGFVAYPPLTPLIQRIGFDLFGVSLVGLRLASVLAQAAALVLTGLMARELGGRRLAQCIAATSVAVSLLPLFEGTEFQYSSFDYLWWVLTAYCVARLLGSGGSRWWVGIGLALGMGLMTKYSIIFFIAGLLVAVLLTPLRAELKRRWFWTGVALALLIFLPNLIWQARHGFISYDFLQHIHARDVRQGRASGFLRDQFLICTNPFTVPIWVAGLVFYFSKSGKRFRSLGLMWVAPFTLFWLAKGRGYYVAAAYPMLFAAGGLVYERCIEWLAARSSSPASGSATSPDSGQSVGRAFALGPRTAVALTFVLLFAGGVGAAFFVLPLQAVDSPRNFMLKNNGDLREEIGWNELVQTVANIRDGLPPEQRAHLGIIAGNYGEAGAIDLLGPARGLPPVISGTNSGWLRGYGDPPPQTFIVLGLSREEVDRAFHSCTLAGHNGNRYGIENEESMYHPDIFLCGVPVKPWPVLWPHFKSYG